MRWQRPKGQNLINAVGALLVLLIVAFSLVLGQWLADAARVNVNGQTAAVAGSTAYAANQALAGDQLLARTISQEDGVPDALRNNADASNNLLLLIHTNFNLLRANPRIVGLNFFLADGSYLFGQINSPAGGQPMSSEEPPPWYSWDNRLRQAMEAMLRRNAPQSLTLYSLDSPRDPFGMLHIFQRITSAGGRQTLGVLVEEVRAASVFQPYVGNAVSGCLFLVGPMVIGPDLLPSLRQARLPLLRYDPFLDGSLTGTLRASIVSLDLSGTHPSFSLDGLPVVGTRQTVRGVTINGAPLVVLQYASAASISEAAKRVLALMLLFALLCVAGVGSLIYMLNRRLSRGEHEATRRVQLKNSELVTANHQLEEMATTDALTGLPNRTCLQDRLHQALAQAGDQHASLGLLLLDLDRFKEINDTLGHDCGDSILQHVGERLRGAVRGSDTVARLGGDEFAVVLPTLALEAARRIAAKLRHVMSVPFTVEGMSLEVDVSIGIALYPDHGTDSASLLRCADVAMYEAKRLHAGVAVYQPTDDQHSARRLVRMSRLREAIAHDQLQLHYQPKLDLVTKRVHAVEALVRWPQPDGSFIPPDQFIPQAEHTGLIGPLTDWVLETALRQCRLWQDQGVRLGVAVNFSMRTLQDRQVLAAVSDLLRRYAIDPCLLTVEITESALMADPERALEIVRRLDLSGVQVSIDDFGTGYSSLGYVKRFPVREIKLDKSFILALGQEADGTDQAIVRSVITMAQALHRTVVAEGVEHGAALAVLEAMGCDTAQGYFISRPLPAADLLRWLAAQPTALLVAG